MFRKIELTPEQDDILKELLRAPGNCECGRPLVDKRAVFSERDENAGSTALLTFVAICKDCFTVIRQGVEWRKLVTKA